MALTLTQKNTLLGAKHASSSQGLETPVAHPQAKTSIVPPHVNADRLDQDISLGVQQGAKNPSIQDGLEQPAGHQAARLGVQCASHHTRRTSPVAVAKERASLAGFRAEMPIHDQGQENSCGTTSLAMAMAYLGVPADYRIVDRSVRVFDPGAGAGAVPGDMVQFARRAGLEAEQYNDGTIDALVSHVRAGRPVTVLLNYENANDGMAHYLNVVGFNRNADGAIESVIMINPWGSEETMPYKNFMQQWSNISITKTGFLAALPTFNRTMVVLERPENPTLPPPGVGGALRAASTNTLMSGFKGFSAGVETMKRGDAVAGAGQMVGASINTVIGGASYLVGNFIGQNIERGGAGLIDAGLEMLNGNIAEKAGGIFSLIFGGVLNALGTILSWIGGAIAGAGNLMAMPFNACGEASSQRHETREMLLNRSRWGGVEEPSYVLSRASTLTKCRMLENLLDNSGVASAEDQAAAMVILRSAQGDERELALLAESFGGAQEFVENFSKEHAIEFASLYQFMNPSISSSGEVISVA